MTMTNLAPHYTNDEPGLSHTSVVYYYLLYFALDIEAAAD
jgi:hypothetical protein